MSPPPPSSSPSSRHRLLLLLLSLLLLLLLRHQTAAAITASHKCSSIDSTYASSSQFHANLNYLLNSIANETPFKGFFNSSYGEPPYTIFGTAVCVASGIDGSPRYDPPICEECLTLGIEEVQRECSNSTKAVVVREFCELAYSNETIAPGSPYELPLLSSGAPSPSPEANRLIGKRPRRGPPLFLLSIPVTVGVLVMFIVCLKTWQKKNAMKATPPPYFLSPLSTPSAAESQSKPPLPAGGAPSEEAELPFRTSVDSEFYQGKHA